MSHIRVDQTAHLHTHDACRSHSALPNASDFPEHAEHLVIDAERAGSISRFINHSCAANVVNQTVLLPGAGAAVLYGIAFFTETDVPAMTELRWNYYGGTAGEAEGGTVRCRCGSTPCRKWLY